MSTPFDRIAPSYAALWSDTPNGRAQREQVWQELDRLFHPGDHVLDLGCGTGDDAVHLAGRGVRVTGIDASEAMVGQASGRGVEARVLRIEALAEIKGSFDGVISNFGALNCVEDLRAVSGNLAPLIKPGGKVAICVLSRFYPREWLSEPARAFHRLRGRAVWRGMPVYYRSAGHIRRDFTPHFLPVSFHAIGGGDHSLLVFVSQCGARTRACRVETRLDTSGCNLPSRTGIDTSVEWNRHNGLNR